MKSPVSDAFDSNVNNSNAVNNLFFSHPFLSGHFRLQKYEMFLSWPKKVFRRVGEEGRVEENGDSDFCPSERFSFHSVRPAQQRAR